MGEAIITRRGGGGNEINGVKTRVPVAEGSTLTKGDFFALSETFTANTSVTFDMMRNGESVRLNDNLSIFIAYRSCTAYLTPVIYQNGLFSYGTTLSVTGSTSGYKCSASRIDDNRLIITEGMPLKAHIIKWDGDALSLVDTIVIDSKTSGLYTSTVVTIDNTKAFVAYCSVNTMYVSIVNFDDTGFISTDSVYTSAAGIIEGGILKGILTENGTQIEVLSHYDSTLYLSIFDTTGNRLTLQTYTFDECGTNYGGYSMTKIILHDGYRYAFFPEGTADKLYYLSWSVSEQTATFKKHALVPSAVDHSGIGFAFEMLGNTLYGCYQITNNALAVRTFSISSGTITMKTSKSIATSAELKGTSSATTLYSFGIGLMSTALGWFVVWVACDYSNYYTSLTKAATNVVDAETVYGVINGNTADENNMIDAIIPSL